VIQDIQLIRVQDNQLVDAVLVTLAERHLNDFEQLWKAALRASTEEDKFWSWEMKHRVYLSQPTYEGYAIECDNQTQGLMLIETRLHRSWYDSNRRVVYVHSLSTAPWNRPSLSSPSLYRATGGTLLEFARVRSEALGYGGLVGLHSLEGAEDFYRRMRMSECGPDEEKEDLIYFEWYRPQEPALEWWDTIDEA
jgi:hypothetical protein